MVALTSRPRLDLRNLTCALWRGTLLDEELAEVSMLRFTLHTLAAGFVRRTWLVTVIAVLVCASFAAHAVAALVEADHLAPTTPRGLPLPRVAPVTASPRAALDGSALVERNMFCSTCGPMPEPTDAPLSNRAAILLATDLSTHDARATVRVIDTEAQGSWGLGERIPGVGTIARIGGVSIDVVDGAGRTTRLSLLDGPSVRGGDGSSAATQEPPAAPFADRIKKIDDHTFEVDRSFVRDLVSGVSKPGGVRMIPIVTDGDVKGVRLASVRAGSIPAAVGLKNADVINAIDGDPIKGAQQLLDLYAKLDQLSSVELQGTRGGKPLAISLRLR